MPEISSEGARRLRLPPPFEGVNVNFCKNPLCSNFGVPAALEDGRGRKRRGSNEGSSYVVVGNLNGGSIRCSCCNTHTVIKSNRAVWEEFDRHLAALSRPHGHHCPDERCFNHHKLVDSHPEAYHRHGKTIGGIPRYRCKACRATFSARTGHSRHRKSHENRTVFQLLVSKVAIAKIAQIADLSPAAVYDKIDFIYGQCRKFLAERERRLPEMELGNMRTCTDMQDYMVNWADKALRKTIQFRAIATSCLETGYVIACHPQIDTRFSTDEVQEKVVDCGDMKLRPAFREFARLWNYEDYASALSLSPDVFRPVREDQELPEHMTADRQLPDQGAMIHIDYLAFGHFMFLRNLLRGADRIHFSLDADPGLANAVFASWTDKAKARKIDVAVMTCDKAATIDEKNAQVAKANKLKAIAIEQYPKLHPFKAFLTYFVDTSILGTLSGPRRGLALKEREIEYPFIKKSEPGKRVRLYTDDGSRTAVEIAGIIHDTSLHQVDRFFMQVRRSIAGLERAPSYPRRASRKWYLYGFYSPEMVEKALVIYRTYFNFIAKGQDGKTPAMRIGLAKGAIRFEDVLYFS